MPVYYSVISGRKGKAKVRKNKNSNALEGSGVTEKEILSEIDAKAISNKNHQLLHPPKKQAETR